MINAQSKYRWAAAMVAAILTMLAAAIAAPAQTFTTLVNFNGTDGAYPQASLVQGTDGNFYGNAVNGGNTSCDPPFGCGTVFKVTASGTLTTLYTFCARTNCTDGAYPYGGLVLGSDENFYGMTNQGGASNACTGGCGTIFKITSRGALTTLYSFCAHANCTDGASPYATLIQGTDGNFYGTTYLGGTSDFCSGGCGTVFKISPKGTLTTVHSFDDFHGDFPIAGLVQGTDGNFYGTTTGGGASGFGWGTIFKMTPGGKLTTLHSFDFTDGANPEAGLIQASDGNFYGTTVYGGTVLGLCAGGCGTVFKITSTGTLTSLHSFDYSDGAYITAGVIQATDGNLYGTSAGGGDGSIFKIVPSGTLTTLHYFNYGTDGEGPGGVNQATNGTFYGTTVAGADGVPGSVFSLAVGLGPFVTTLPTSRPIGQRVAILGNNLTGSTSVTFNGAPATFTVVSSTEISTTVPTGATSGPVQVVTPSGTLTSNVNFRVLP